MPERIALLEFRERFPDIRVTVDWTRCLPGWPIVERRISLLEARADIYTPWYALVDGTPCNYKTVGAVPQSITSAARNPLLLQFHGVLPTPPAFQSVVLPAYQLPSENEVLLLDGNHRLVSAAAGEWEMNVTLLVMQGAVDDAVLPDLKHWISSLPR